ncbi:hypothetical protein AQ611_06790 [Burkholderia singularis]|nr:hypothetical protein AQ611_06790 [Burkholderia sp. Bp7605]
MIGSLAACRGDAFGLAARIANRDTGGKMSCRSGVAPLRTRQPIVPSLATRLGEFPAVFRPALPIPGLS